MNKKIFYILILAILVIFVLFFFTKFLKIKKIKCIEENGCSVSLVDNFKKIEGNAYFSAKTKILSYLKSEVLVRNYTIRLVLPDTIEIFLIERKEEVAISSESKFVLLDSQDTVIKFSDKKENLPTINLYDGENYKFKLGDNIENKLKFATKLSKDLSDFYSVKETILEKNAIVANLNDRKIIFPREGDEDLLMGTLKFVLSWLNNTPNTSKIKTLDLRFKNPVLKEANG